MIEYVDRAVERLFRDKVPLEEASVAISFETPDREWSAARTRPTVSVFLWDLSRSSKALRAGLDERVDDQGARQRRQPQAIVDLQYAVTAWASEPRDEHQLLGSLVACVVSHPRLPEEVLPEPLRGARCGLDLAPPGARPPGELWAAFGGVPRAALQLTVSLPLHAFAWRATAPAAEVVELAVDPRTDRDGDRAPEASAEVPTLTRRRKNGALVMEGRREPRGPVGP